MAVRAAPTEPVLLGALSLDIYVGRGLVLPGGGILNMAWHWAHVGKPFRLISRVGDDQPAVFTEFLAHHGIMATLELVGRGASASIDIVIQHDLQPRMDNFVEGVWADFASTPAEEAVVAAAPSVHLVLVEGAIRELSRLHAAGVVGAGAGPEVTADFLGFRHYTVERLAQTMQAVDIGFVGWPGAADDDTVTGIRDVAHKLRRLIVVTLGSRGVLVFDGRPADAGGIGDVSVPVVPVPVQGTTVGCGDAFVAAFLASWHARRDVLSAVEAGKAAGAAATAWRRPLPDSAYGPEAVAALQRADEAAAL